ncbi:MAG: hypothetical protein LUF02_10005 [Erysipelotrichaceae bacterium]|nr:hypothetical protein [Erysipelotrichaceae bacterium]
MKKIIMILISLTMIGCSNKIDNYSLKIEEYESTHIIEINEAKDIYNDFLELDYSSITCDGISEYMFTFIDDEIYYVNISDKWVWSENKEALLTDDMIEEIQELLEMES